MENEIFEQMPIPKAYFKIALPVVIGMVISLIYNLADTWFIARTGNTALVAGVSLCAPIFTLMVAFSDIFGLGGSNLISRLLGQGRREEVSHVSAFSLFGALGFGAVTAIVMLLFRGPILSLLGASAETMPYASSYYFWLALGAPAIILNVVPGNLLRTEGLSEMAMVCTVTGAVLNIVLDPIFIFGLEMEAAGAALATVLSNLISDILFLTVMRRKSKVLSIRLRDCRINTSMLGSILSIGIPASVTNLMQSLAVLLTNRCLVDYGTDKIAALGIAMKVNMVCMLILVGFAFGAQPALGYCFGARNEERLRGFLRFDVQVQMVLSLVFIGIVFLFTMPILEIFMKDPQVVGSGAVMLRCLTISAPAVGVILVMTTLFQAEGKALPALILAISRQGVVLVLCLFVLQAVLGYKGIIIAQPAADVITLGIAGVLLKKYSFAAEA